MSYRKVDAFQRLSAELDRASPVRLVPGDLCGRAARRGVLPALEPVASATAPGVAPPLLKRPGVAPASSTRRAPLCDRPVLSSDWAGREQCTAKWSRAARPAALAHHCNPALLQAVAATLSPSRPRASGGRESCPRYRPCQALESPQVPLRHQPEPVPVLRRHLRLQG